MRHDEAYFTAREPELSAPQAARALGVSLSTIYRWSDLGYLTSHRTATGQRRFSSERIASFISLLDRQHVDPPRDRQAG